MTAEEVGECLVDEDGSRSWRMPSIGSDVSPL